MDERVEVTEDGIEVHYRSDGKTVKYVKDKEGNEIHYQKDGETVYFTRDSDGNQVYYKKDGKTVAFTMDADDNMVCYQKDGKTIAYTRDKDGNEVHYQKDGKTVAYARDTRGRDLSALYAQEAQNAFNNRVDARYKLKEAQQRLVKQGRNGIKTSKEIQKRIPPVNNALRDDNSR